MARDTEFEVVKSRLLKEKAENSRLREQLANEKEAWEDKDKEYKVTESLARDLCRLILCKDHSEQKLGCDYTWDRLHIHELLRKAKDVFQEYNKTLSNKMEDLVDQIEKRGRTIEGLTGQITVFLTQEGLKGENLENAMTSIKNDGKISKAIKKNLPKQTETMVVNGQSLEIVADELLDDSEQLIFNEVAEMQVSEGISSVSIPRRESRDRVQQKKDMKKKAVKAHVTDLAKIEDSLNDEHWHIIEEIGMKGYSKYVDIETAVLTKYPETPKNKIRTAVRELHIAHILESEVIGTPIAKKQFLYKFSSTGAEVFTDQYGGTPVQAEMDRVRGEHDNYEHGYGIMEVTSVIQEKEFYDFVTCFNRDNPIQLTNGRQYVPDIFAKIGKRKDYYEYERATHTQSDFDDKCNNMTQVTRFLNFVCPNKETLLKLEQKVIKWMTNKGQEALVGVKIRITTVQVLQNGDLRDDSCWAIIYNPGVSMNPIKHP